MRALALPLSVVLLVGCPAATAAPDAAPADTGPADLGTDAASTDAAQGDAGPLPEPRADYGALGPHAVGNVTVTMMDRTGLRMLPVEIWYPAVESARAEATAGRSIETFEAGTPHATDLHDLVLAAPAACVRRTMHSAAAPAALTGPALFPVVVFSHCHSCTRFDMAEAAERLASHGIVVAAPDHLTNTLWDELLGMSATIGAPFLAVRASDVSSVLDRLLDPTATEVPADLRGRLDPAHAGVMGHSFGAATTSLVIETDARFIAALAVAAPISVIGGVRIADLHVPYLFLLMREDNSVGEIGNRLIRADYTHVGASAAIVELDDAGHWSISDLCGLIHAFDAGCGDGVRGSPPAGAAFTYVDPNLAREVAADTAAAFFATHLLEDPGGDTVLRRLDGTQGAHVSLRR